MVDLGKCRIRQLKNFQGQMMAGTNFKEMSEFFSPFDENYATELADQLGTQGTKKNASINESFDGFNNLPPGIDPIELEKIQT